ncbi:MAG: T9SS type A sorting domain-containing protein [Crocinitomicaceae bacterium]
MKSLYKKLALMSIAFVGLAITNQTQAQCSIVSLADVYCLDADPVVLTATPPGGTFSGPGVIDGIFYPEVAGVGTHTIDYEYIPGGNRYYLHSTVGNPWSSTSNAAAMNTAFGSGEWEEVYFETLDIDEVFSGETSMIFMDGSDDNATEMASFLAANLSTIEDWVAAGGCILMNSAPNEGGDINVGFDGTVIDYSFFMSTVTVADLAHPIYVGPNTPTSSTMTGSSYCHARVLGTGYTTILTGSGSVALCEKEWGLGHVLVGGMTTANYHNPDPHAENWRANIMVYLDELVDFPPCTASQDVEVLDEVSPDVVASADVEEICVGESYTVTASGADDFYWGGDIVDGEPNTPEVAGTYSHIVTGISDAGCLGTDMVSIVVHPTPIVDAGLDQAQCVGEELTLSGSGAATYSWDPAVTDGEPFTVMTEDETTYTVTGTNEFGCEGTDEMVVTGIGTLMINAVVTDEYEAFGASIDLTITGGSGPFAYTWSHGPTTEDVSGLSEGSYMVTVNDLGVEEGICADADSIFTIMSFIGVEDLEGTELQVYPSPAVDNITIVYAGPFNYELTTITGEIVLKGNAVDQEEITVAELAAGTYMINIIVDEKVTTAKVVKQ